MPTLFAHFLFLAKGFLIYAYTRVNVTRVNSLIHAHMDPHPRASVAAHNFRKHYYSVFSSQKLSRSCWPQGATSGRKFADVSQRIENDDWRRLRLTCHSSVPSKWQRANTAYRWSSHQPGLNWRCISLHEKFQGVRKIRFVAGLKDYRTKGSEYTGKGGNSVKSVFAAFVHRGL